MHVSHTHTSTRAMDAQAQSRREALHALRLMHPHAASAAAVEALLPPPSAPLPALASAQAAAAGSAQLQVSREQAKQSLLAQAPRPQQFAAAFDALRARACVFRFLTLIRRAPTPTAACLRVDMILWRVHGLDVQFTHISRLFCFTNPSFSPHIHSPGVLDEMTEIAALALMRGPAFLGASLHAAYASH